MQARRVIRKPGLFFAICPSILPFWLKSQVAPSMSLETEGLQSSWGFFTAAPIDLPKVPLQSTGLPFGAFFAVDLKSIGAQGNRG